MVFALYMTISGMADADAQAWEGVSMQVPDDILHAIMPCGTASGAQANFAHREIKFIVDHQHIFRLQFVPAHKFPNRFAAQVHVGERLGKHDFLQSQVAARQDCPAAPFVPFPAVPGCQFIYYAKTNVVPRSFIFHAWIAQANHQFHFIIRARIAQANYQLHGGKVSDHTPGVPPGNAVVRPE